MKEISEIHNITMEWGCITNLLDRISTLEETIGGGWPELIDMVADSVTKEATNKNETEVFFHLYGFLFHLYYRIKRNPQRREFNQYSCMTNKKGEKTYKIKNYTYSIYKWAIKKGATNEIDNDIIGITAGLMTDEEKKAIERRIKND